MAENLFLTAFALCFMAFLQFSYADEYSPIFLIKGRVYCDPCKVDYETKFSRPVNNASVRIVCGSGGHPEGLYKTGKDGTYGVRVGMTARGQACEVFLENNPDSQCNIINPTINRAKFKFPDVELQLDKTVHVKPIGFVGVRPLEKCKELKKR